MDRVKLTCTNCGSDEWEGFEDVVRVTGQQGHKPEKITIGGCSNCGHQQEVTLPES
jgi:uncharacterized Zn finger protein